MARKKKTEEATTEPKPAMTLTDLSERYLRHMEDSGKSQGTCFSYKLELVTAMDELGKDTLVGDLTPVRVLEYFASARVNKTKTGVEKARRSVLKSQRVLRLALVRAEEAKLIEKAPLPEQAAAY